MNIAVATFIIFLLVIPGMAFRHAFMFGHLTKKFSRSSAFDDFIYAIIPGVIIQLLGAMLVKCWSIFDTEVNFLGIGKILYNADTAYDQFENIEQNIGFIFLYQLSLIVIGAFFGWLFRAIIRWQNWDHKSTIFRFNNEWHYLLKGEFVFFRESRKYTNIPIQQKSRFKSNERIDFCHVNASVKTDEGKCYIYTGVIETSHLAKDGRPEIIVLREASRRAFTDDREQEVYHLNTKILVLKYSEIITLSVNPGVLPITKTLKGAIRSKIAKSESEGK